MHNILAVDANSAHAERLVQTLAARKQRVDVVGHPNDAVSWLSRGTPTYDLVIIHVSGAAQPWLAILERLQKACSDAKPLFLCVSSQKYPPEFELAPERKGARYVFEQ